MNRKIFSLIFWALVPVLWGQHIYWEKTNGPVGGYVHLLHSDEEQQYAFVHGLGIISSEDTWKSWQVVSESCASYFISHFEICNNGNFIAIGNDKVLMSYDRGISWNELQWENSHETFKSLYKDLSGFIYISSDLHCILRSTDNGENWTDISNNLNSSGFKKIFFRNNRIYAASNFDVYYWTEENSNWTELSSLSVSHVGDLDVNKNLVLVGSQYSGLFLSTDGGENWQALTNPFANSLVSAVEITNENIFYVVFEDKGIIKSEDLGETWTVINDIQHSNEVNSIFSCGDDQLVLGSSYGISRVDFSDLSWSYIHGCIKQFYQRFNKFWK